MRKILSVGHLPDAVAALMASVSAPYYVVQVFIAFAEHPETPVVVRIDATSRVKDLVQKALIKFWTTSTADLDFDALGFIRAEDYILQPSRGDGSPDNSSRPLKSSDVLRDLGLKSPYMLYLDSASSMDNKGYGSTRNSAVYANLPPGSPADQSSSHRNSTHQISDSTLQVFREQWHKQKAIDDLRDSNLRRLERLQAEKDRMHLEACERTERARRQAVAHQRAEEESEFRVLEERYSQEMARRSEEHTKELQQKQAPADEREVQRSEDKRRRQRHILLERELMARQSERDTARQREAEERSQASDPDQQARWESTLASIVARLDTAIQFNSERSAQADALRTDERAAAVVRQREKEAAEHAERQRKLLEEAEVMEREAEKARRKFEEDQRAFEEEGARQQKAAEERHRFELWRADRWQKLSSTSATNFCFVEPRA
jgi:hypothetical protein